MNPLFRGDTDEQSCQGTAHGTNCGQTVYLVADDMGDAGPVWRQSECGFANREAVIQDMLAGEYSNPMRVVAFNTAEGWSEDVSADVA